jgi:type IV pilus assembly protein PilC
MIINYQALNRSGMLVNDTLVVENESEAYSELKRLGLVPVRLIEGSKSASSEGLIRMLARLRPQTAIDPRKASRRELPLFIEQMAILLETGTPVAPSLTALERQVTSSHWQVLVRQLRQQVEDGGSLASAVASYPEVFDPIYSSMISAGEASGTLPVILNRLAQLSRQSDRIRKKIVSAMIYPALLMGIATTVVVVLLFFVLPRFATIFTEMDVTLPGSTTALLAISDFVRGHPLVLLVGLGAVVSACVLGLRSRGGQRLIQRNVLRLPIFGPLIKSIISARIFRLQGLLSESSVPLLESIELSKSSTRNYLYKDMLTQIHDNVLSGQSMYEIMLQSNLVNPSIAQMVHTGEENAQIGRVMTLLANHLDDHNDTQISTLTNIMEPVILVFMGLIIGTVAISLVLPMFDLSRISA